MLPKHVQWLRIARTKSIGPVSFKYLHKNFSLQEAFEKVQQKAQIPSEHSIYMELQSCLDYGAQLISIFDKQYPQRLKQLRDSPSFLCAKGNLALLQNKSVSIVGARNASIANRSLAYSIAKELVEHDYTVVSGLAAGIDTQVHLGGIQNTIAIMASGINKVYPPENQSLYDKILANNGLILTELPYDTQPASYMFPNRNRLIAGISDDLILVEGTLNSGSLLTASYANDYGRNVYAVPGSPLDPRSKGPNKLIKEGAMLLESARDVIKNTLQYSPLQPTEDDTIITGPEDLESQILAQLSHTPSHIDYLAQQITQPIQVVKSALVELEIAGKVRHIAGNKVVLHKI